MAAISHAVAPASTPGTARIMVNTFDGTRRLMPAGTPTLITVRDGWGTQQQYTRPGPSVDLEGLQVYGNSGDNYTVIASIGGYKQAGFYPVPVSVTVH